ncbi:MAG: hypothetical protein AB7K09_16350 [Planctomycetota bacterium]
MTQTRTLRLAIPPIIFVALLALLLWWLLGGTTDRTPPPAPHNHRPSAITATNDDNVATDDDHVVIPPDDNRPPTPDAGPPGVPAPDNAPADADAASVRLLRIRDWHGKPIDGVLLIWPLDDAGPPTRLEVPGGGAPLYLNRSGPVAGLAGDGGIVSSALLGNEPDERREPAVNYPGIIWLDAAEPGVGFISPALRAALDGGASNLPDWPMQSWVRVVDDTRAAVADSRLQLRIGRVEETVPNCDVWEVTDVDDIVVHTAPAPLVHECLERMRWSAVARTPDRAKISAPHALSALSVGHNTLLLGQRAALRVRLVDQNHAPYANRLVRFPADLSNVVPFRDVLRNLLQLAQSGELHLLSGIHRTDDDGIIDLGDVPAGKWGMLPPDIRDDARQTLGSANDRITRLVDVPPGETRIDVVVPQVARVEFTFVTPQGDPVLPGTTPQLLLLPRDEIHVEAWTALHDEALADERIAMLTANADDLRAQQAVATRTFAVSESVPDGFLLALRPWLLGKMHSTGDGAWTTRCEPTDAPMLAVVRVGIDAVIPVGPIALAPGSLTRRTVVVVRAGWFRQRPDNAAIYCEILVRPPAVSAGLSYQLFDGTPGGGGGTAPPRQSGTIDADGVIRIESPVSGAARLVVEWATPDGPGGVFPCDFTLRADAASPDRYVTDLARPGRLHLELAEQQEPADPRTLGRLQSPAPMLQLHGETLADACAMVGRAAGLRIEIDPTIAGDAAEYRLEMAIPAQLSMKDVLSLFTDLLGVAWRVRGSRVVVMPVEAARIFDGGGPTVDVVDAGGHRTIWRPPDNIVVVTPGPVTIRTSPSGSAVTIMVPPGETVSCRVGPLCNVIAGGVEQRVGADWKSLSLSRGVASGLLPGRYRVTLKGSFREITLPDDAQPGLPGEPRWWRPE